jgi:hypothetical protein
MNDELINTKKWIWVTFQKAGFHFYGAAPEETGYLKNIHRHLFKFKVKIEVFHNDRDVEFHAVLKFCESLMENEFNMNGCSCEMLSDQLYKELSTKYPGRDMIIDVSEDGECGSTIEYFLNF